MKNQFDEKSYSNLIVVFIQFPVKTNSGNLTISSFSPVTGAIEILVTIV